MQLLSGIPTVPTLLGQKWMQVRQCTAYGILAEQETLAPNLQNLPDAKKLYKVALRGIRDDIQEATRTLRSTHVQHYINPMTGRDWVRIWVCVDIDLSMSYTYDQNTTSEEDNEEHVYYDWTKVSTSGAYIRKTWKAPKKRRPVPTSDEEMAPLIESDHNQTSEPETGTMLSTLLHDSYHSSTTEEADINSRVDAMTDQVAHRILIPQMQPHHRTTSRSRSPVGRAEVPPSSF